MHQLVSLKMGVLKNFPASSPQLHKDEEIVNRPYLSRTIANLVKELQIFDLSFRPGF